MSYQLYDRRRWMSLSRKNYYPFADPVVENIIATNVGDGVGTTLEQIHSCSTYNSDWTSNNTSITEFMELEEFTGIRSLRSALANCTNLKKVSLPAVNYNSSGTQYLCYRCSGLEEVHINSVVPIQSYMFTGCTSWEKLYYPSLEIALSMTWGISRPDLYGSQPFYNHSYAGRVYINNVQLTSCVVPSTITTLNQACLVNTIELEYLDIHANVTSIGRQAFARNASLETIVLRSATPPTLTNTDTFYSINSNAKFYVPYSADHSILATYQAASYWSSFASKMYELNPDGTIPS